MPNKSYAVRIGLDGKAQIERDLAEIAASGDAAFAKLGKSLDQSMRRFREQASFNNLTGAQALAQTASANQSAFNKVLGIGAPGVGSAQASARAFEQSFAAQSAQRMQMLGGALASATRASAGEMASFAAGVTQAAKAEAEMETRSAALRAQLDPLGAVTKRYNGDIEEANMLLARGKLTAEEHAAVLGRAKGVYDASAKAIRIFGGNNAFAVTQMMSLEHAVRGGFEQLAQGRNPFSVLMMESNNLLYALSGGGGLMAMVKELGGNILKFIAGPAGIAAGAIGSMATVLLLAVTRSIAADNELKSATTGLGRATGLTRDQLQALAVSAANANEISVASARGIETAFAATGKIAGGQLKGLIALTDEFYRKTDYSMSQASQVLKKAFADPGKAGEALLASLGELDDKTKTLIESYLKAGDAASAEAVLIGKLTAYLKTATDQTTWYGDAWRWAGRMVSDTIEGISHAFDKVPLDKLQQQLAMFEALKQKSGSNQYDPVIAMLQKQVAAGQAIARAAQATAKASAADQVAKTLSLTAAPYARAALPGYGNLQNLKAGQTQLDKLLASAKAVEKSSFSIQQLKQSQDAYNYAVKSYLDPAQKKAKLDALDLAALDARTPAQKRAIAEQRTAVEVAGTLITKEEAQREIMAAGTKAFAGATHALAEHSTHVKAAAVDWMMLADAWLKGSAAGEMASQNAAALDRHIGHLAISAAQHVANLRDEAAVRKRLNDAVAAGTLSTRDAAEQMANERELAPLLAAYAVSEGAAKTKLAEIIKALTAARANDNVEARRSQALGEAASTQRNVDLLKEQLALVNDGDSARAVENTVLEKKAQLLEQGIYLTSAEGQKIIKNTEQAARLKQQIDLASASRGELESTVQSVATAFGDFIVSSDHSWKSFEAAGRSALNAIMSEMEKLAILNPLQNILFGTKMPTLGSVGGLLGDLVGGGGISQVAITPAASVQTGFAAGTNYAPGGWSWVGEQGPELRYIGRGTQILNHEASMRTVRNASNANSEPPGRGRDRGVTVMPGAVVIQTPNPSAFHASSGQVSAKIAQAVRAGARRL